MHYQRLTQSKNTIPQALQTGLSNQELCTHPPTHLPPTRPARKTEKTCRASLEHCDKSFGVANLDGRVGRQSSLLESSRPPPAVRVVQRRVPAYRRVGPLVLSELCRSVRFCQAACHLHSRLEVLSSTSPHLSRSRKSPFNHRR